MLGHFPVINGSFNNGSFINGAISTGSISVIGLVALAISAQSHCALMCGPIASTIKQPLFYTLGRAVSYGIVGGLVGWIGVIARPEPWLSLVFALLASLLVISSVLNLTGVKDLQWFMPISRRILVSLFRMGPFALGLGTPLLPCGQLWSVMGFAAISGSPFIAAAIGTGFAIISTPGILAFGFMRRLLEGSMRKQHRWVQTTATAVLIVFMCTASAQFVWTSYRLQHQDPESNTELLCK